MQQIQSVISPKFQTVVPSVVRRQLNLKAGDTLLWRTVQTNHVVGVIAEPMPKNWSVYSRGLGKHIWENTNIDDYIKTLRDEWRDQN